MKRGATRKPSGDKNSKSRSFLAQSSTELRRSSGERLSFAEGPLARHDSPLGRLVPVQCKGISKGLANSFEWVRRAAGFPQREAVNTESGTAEWGIEGLNPVSAESPSCNPLRNPGPGLSLNSASYRIAAPVEGGTGPCWNECVCYEFGIILPEEAGSCFDVRVLVPAASPELLRTSKKWQRTLSQLDLQLPLPPGKTSWDVIVELRVLLKPVSIILEARVDEVSSKFDLYRSSANLNGNEEYYIEDSENSNLYEALCKNFEEVSRIASDRSFQALNRSANYIDETQHITDCASTCLLPAVIDLVEMYSRIRRVEETLILNKERTIDSARRISEEEERAFDCACRLTEAISNYVISIQSQVLHSARMHQDGVETPREDTSVLQSRLQQSWIWQNKLSKQVLVLCPHKKQQLFVYLLERVIEAVCELSEHQKLLPVLNDKSCEEHKAAACFCQRILLHSLMRLFKNAEKNGLELRKEGLAAVYDFCKTSNASQIYSITLTLLLSTIAEQGGNTTTQSQHYTKTLQNYGTELMSFAYSCVKVIGDLASENAAGTDEIDESAGDVIDGQDNVDSELPESVGPVAELGSTEELPEATNDENRVQLNVDSTPANSEEAAQAAQRSSNESSGRQRRASAFENHSVHAATESPNEARVADVHGTTDGNTIEPSRVVDPDANFADQSLNRTLPSLPSISAFGIVNIKAMRQVEVLGEGSSAQVILAMLDNTCVALKMLKCPVINVARKRLERESKIHQRISIHPNIVRFLGRAVQTDESGEDQIVGIITEWCELGTLSKAIEEAAWAQQLEFDGQDTSVMRNSVGYQLYTNWIKRLEVVAGIAAGMTYMHGCHVVHRDLKSANVLLEIVDVGNDIRSKVCDFERTYFLKDDTPIQRTAAISNSPPWMGLEVLNHEKYGLKADVYSIGTILWELMYLRDPWTQLKENWVGADEIAIQQLLSSGTTSLPISEEDAPDDVPEFPELVKLVKHAWSRDPEDRPTMSEFYKKVMEICARMKERLSVEEARVKETLPDHDISVCVCN